MLNRGKYTFELNGDELVQRLADQVDSFQDYVVNTGRARAWKKNRDFYENRMFGESEDVDIIDAGAVGEMKALTFCHYRNIIRHMLNGLTANIPSFSVSALNTTVAARRASKVGKQLVKYYHKVRRVNKPLTRQSEYALVYGDGYIAAEWNSSAGKEVAVEADDDGNPTEQTRHEGEFDIFPISPFHVFWDPTIEDRDQRDWVTYRRRLNKYTIAARHSDKKEQILALETATDTDLYGEYLLHQRHEEYIEESDDIYVYTTVHRATEAIEKGRWIIWCGDRGKPVLLYEGDNPFRDKLNVFTLSPGQYLESSFGFTEANVLRAPQMILTLCISYMVSNMEAFGANNVWCPDPNLTIEEITDGLNLLKSSVKPEVVSFYRDNPGFEQLLGLCVNTMETLSGQNAVVRGNVAQTPNLKSGVALATVIQQATQYNHALEKGYFDLYEDLYSFILWFLKIAPDTERVYEIVGNNSQQIVSSFKKEHIKDLSRVVIDKVNPIAMNPAGQVEIAEGLLEKGLITVQQYFEVINTGNLDVATESEERMMDYIAAVKEKLLEGESVQPIYGINHQLFLQEISSLLYDLDLMTDPASVPVVENIKNLIQGHMKIAAEGDMIADLIFGGKPPTPPKIGNAEVPSIADGSAPPPGPGGGGMPPQQIAPPAQPPGPGPGPQPGPPGMQPR